MPTNYKVLGQSAPSATTNTDVYTVPSATEAVISSIIVANRATGSATYRIAVRPDGDTIADEHYIAYDAEIPQTDTIALTLGITLSASDKITVYATPSTGSVGVSFNVFGSEIS
jgi:glucose-6-phosphate dehydrogenase assembly protein OpcA